jgi:hypothetical protein
MNVESDHDDSSSSKLNPSFESSTIEKQRKQSLNRPTSTKTMLFTSIVGSLEEINY